MAQEGCGEAVQAFAHISQVGLQVDAADPLVVEHDLPEQDQLIVCEATAILFDRRRRERPVRMVTKIPSQHSPIPSVDAGRHDVRLGTQRFQEASGGVCIIKGERSGAVRSNHFRQGSQVVHLGLPECVEVVWDEYRAGQQQRYAACDHDDRRQFAADGKIAKAAHIRSFRHRGCRPRRVPAPEASN